MPRVGDAQQPDDPRCTDQVRRRDPQTRESARMDESQSSDSINLSTDAQVRAELTEEARNLPDVREDRIAEIRERIASGELDTEEVRRVIADRMLDQLGI